MYPEVRIELARQNMSILDLAKEIDMRYQTLTAKLRGESDITLDDAAAIKAGLKSKLPIEDLFRKDGS